jgi:hypothetical protein
MDLFGCEDLFIHIWAGTTTISISNMLYGGSSSVKWCQHKHTSRGIRRVWRSQGSRTWTLWNSSFHARDRCRLREGSAWHNYCMAGLWFDCTVVVRSVKIVLNPGAVLP